MSYRHRREPGDEGYGAWLVPPGSAPPSPAYEGADALRAYRHWKNRQNGITRARPSPPEWDALHATFCEQQQTRGIALPPPLPWHHEPDAEAVPHADLRAWARWYDTCSWAVTHGLGALLPPRISERAVRTRDAATTRTSRWWLAVLVMALAWWAVSRFVNGSA